MIRLNIACGANVFPDWVNIDRTDVEEQYLRHLRGLPEDQISTWPEHQRKLVGYLNEGRIHFKQQDLRKGFPEYADGTVDAIYLGQIVEHLNPLHELPKLLAECFRMLRSGGAARITTPNLELILNRREFNALDQFAAEQPDFYRGADDDDKLSYLLFGACGPDSTFDNYEGHMHIYTGPNLRRRVQQAGFDPVVATYIPEPMLPLFDGCIDCGMSHSFAIEAVKP